MRVLILQLKAGLEKLRIALKVESVKVPIPIAHLQPHILGKRPSSPSV